MMLDTKHTSTPDELADSVASVASLKSAEIHFFCTEAEKREVHYYLQVEESIVADTSRMLGGFSFNSGMVGGTAQISEKFSCKGRQEGWSNHACNCSLVYCKSHEEDSVALLA